MITVETIPGIWLQREVKDSGHGDEFKYGIFAIWSELL
jgi:hypothetical protein